MTLQVGVALSARSWRGALQRHCRDHVADMAIALLHDGRDGFVGGVQVVVVDDDTSWLSVPFVSQAGDLGIQVIGIFDPLDSDGHGRHHLERLGVTTVVESSIGSEELIDLIRSREPDMETKKRFETLTAGLAGRTPVEHRRVLAVGGPAGAGATEVSIAAVMSLSRSGRRPILVDVDETHPSLARRLGLALHPHLLAAVDASRRQTGTDDWCEVELADCLARSAIGDRRLPFDVIVGLASRDDWPMGRPDEVGDLVAELAAEWSDVVVRLGPCLEDLSRHVPRFEISRHVASRVDAVIGVCDGTVTGVLRFIDWLVDLLGVVDDVPIKVLVNRAPRSTAARTQLLDQLWSIAGDRLDEMVCVGVDRKVARAAWDARPVVSGRLFSAVGHLVPA